VLVSDTFRTHEPIESGRIALSFSVSSLSESGVRGSQALGLQLQGPFEGHGSGRLPSFALQLGLQAGSLTGAGGLQAGLVSTGGQLYLELAGASFVAPRATMQALEQGYARAVGSASSRQSTFALLGAEPGQWLVDPRVVGRQDVAGVETTVIEAGLDTARFAADAEKLAGAAGAAGAAGLAGSGPAALASPGAISSLAGSLRSARVFVYTGVHDHLLHRIHLQGLVATTPQARAELGGLSRAAVAFTLQFGGLNQPQAIAAPRNPQPISQLIPALAQLGLVPGSPAGG